MTPRRAVWARVDFAAPKSLIIIWSGAVDDIPEGWVLCDGTNATPNLADRFILHEPDYYELTDEDRQYGFATGTINSHNHDGGATEAENEHVHAILDELQMAAFPYTLFASDTGASPFMAPHTHSFGDTTAGSDHQHNINGVDSHVDDVEVSTIPPFYALAYIMGTGDVPVGAMALVFLLDPYPESVWNPVTEEWEDGPSPLPTGYVVCDGDNGTIDLWDQYIVGAGNEYLLGQQGGEYYLMVAAHQHDTSGMGVVAETEHLDHGYLPFWITSTYSGSNATYLSGLSPWEYYTNKNHAHWTDLSAGLAATTHAHDLTDDAVGAEAGVDSGESFPPSYRLTWVMRVS